MSLLGVFGLGAIKAMYRQTAEHADNANHIRCAPGFGKSHVVFMGTVGRHSRSGLACALGLYRFMGVQTSAANGRPNRCSHRCSLHLVRRIWEGCVDKISFFLKMTF